MTQSTWLKTTLATVRALRKKNREIEKATLALEKHLKTRTKEWTPPWRLKTRSTIRKVRSASTRASSLALRLDDSL